MGEWQITLHGAGPDNPAPGEDGGSLLARFVDDLKARGHEVHQALFDHMGHEVDENPPPAPQEGEAPAAEEPAPEEPPAEIPVADQLAAGVAKEETVTLADQRAGTPPPDLPAPEEPAAPAEPAFGTESEPEAADMGVAGAQAVPGDISGSTPAEDADGDADGGAAG